MFEWFKKRLSGEQALWGLGVSSLGKRRLRGGRVPPFQCPMDKILSKGFGNRKAGATSQWEAKFGNGSSSLGEESLSHWRYFNTCWATSHLLGVGFSAASPTNLEVPRFPPALIPIVLFKISG